MWKLHGSWFVPDVSPVCDEERWYSIGTLLAIALLTNGSVHPVSPVLIYALLVASFHKPRLTDIQTTMNFSLNYIRELDELQSRVVLPWMVVPPSQDWRDLPAGHRAELLEIITGLGVDVNLSYTSTNGRKIQWCIAGCQGFHLYSVSDHVRWTAAILQAHFWAMHHFLRRPSSKSCLGGLVRQ